MNLGMHEMQMQGPTFRSTPAMSYLGMASLYFSLS